MTADHVNPEARWPEVAALHSGVVVTAGVLPLLRLMQIDSGLAPLIRWIGIASAVLGLLRALTETDLRRLLAWSTLSQMGLVALSVGWFGGGSIKRGEDYQIASPKGWRKRDERSAKPANRV